MAGESPFRRGGKHDHEASSSSGKKGRPRGSLPTLSSRWCTCTDLMEPVPWPDVHLYEGWYLSQGRVPVPPALCSGVGARREIRCRRALLLWDLHNYPAYDPCFVMWDWWFELEHDCRHRSYFTGEAQGGPKEDKEEEDDTQDEDIVTCGWLGEMELVVWSRRSCGRGSKRRPPTSPSTAQAR
jgi:hypothetical protein